MAIPKETTNTLRGFYPLIDPYKTEYLSVSPLHSLFIQQSGNPEGQPVLYLHGGPGMGSSAGHRRYFDPAKYRIIQFDQRGAGKSLPHACLIENTTWDLVEDIERIRVALGIVHWHVFGGSWGSTLAIAYAARYPTHVTALGLRGIFLCRKKELAWMYQEGANYVYPDQWEKYSAPIPEHQRHDYISAYYRQLTSADPAVQKRAARAWTEWELAMMNMIPSENAPASVSDDFLLAAARIECHYFYHNIFSDDDAALLASVEKLRHIPAVMVQGRHDMVCPPITAWEVHKAWPEAELHIIADACHGFDEPGIVHALVTAADAFLAPEISALHISHRR
ncbi:prolyl aminopeptidase [Paremcibacter congregatus]|uniref:Proline iminopeptidase n=1 Tax=Paremcibacter congregatus TaxID=2043170 RepID=A0A2G4YQW6_9PROT|nr:prolyl aminopeptidase [Paremcibacter congregatus]PHZ84713.1 prolyl aminopeptidase [Paremcibacter congregatus]QDE28908.1 prolyl aminopeptidase [Paremcibacter congregatus]